jgi:hypothetical protein
MGIPIPIHQQELPNTTSRRFPLDTGRKDVPTREPSFDFSSGTRSTTVRQGSRTRLEFMEAQSGEFPVKSMATVLDVSRSGYYKYLTSKKQKKSRYDQDILDMLYTIWKTNRKAYGNIRLTKAMKIEYSPSIGRTKVISMMKLLKIKGKNKQKFKISSTDSNHNEPKVKDLVRRNF